MHKVVLICKQLCRHRLTHNRIMQAFQIRRVVQPPEIKPLIRVPGR